MLMTATISEIAQSCRAWLQGLAQGGLLSLWLGVQPAAASRPRVTRWGTYYSKSYEVFRKEAQTIANKAKGEASGQPLVVLMEVISPRPKTTKRSFPKGDVDNLAKGPLDVMTKAQNFWLDDDQVVGLCVFKRFAEDGEEHGVKVEWTTI